MKRRVASMVLALTSVAASCTAHSDTSTAPSVARPTPSVFGAGGTTWNLVVLGDSISLGAECPGCTPFADLYAKALSRDAAVEVIRTNWSVLGFTTARLLELVRRDAPLRADLARADVVTLTIGVNDMPWNPGADRCGAAANGPDHVEWARITPACLRMTAGRYGELLGRLLDELTALRQGAPTVLRPTGFYDEWVGRSGVAPGELRTVARGIRLFNRAELRVASAHHALVADLLHAFNGPTGTHDAARYLEPSHGVHPNQLGHDLIARVLSRLGLSPLRT